MKHFIKSYLQRRRLIRETEAELTSVTFFKYATRLIETGAVLTSDPIDKLIEIWQREKSDREIQLASRLNKLKGKGK